jgi:hypothetical protein
VIAIEFAGNNCADGDRVGAAAPALQEVDVEYFATDPLVLK